MSEYRRSKKAEFPISEHGFAVFFPNFTFAVIKCTGSNGNLSKLVDFYTQKRSTYQIKKSSIVDLENVGVNNPHQTLNFKKQGEE